MTGPNREVQRAVPKPATIAPFTTKPNNPSKIIKTQTPHTICQNTTMAKNKPITTITATYNCASTMPDYLHSVAQQTYTQRQHIVVDGESTDGKVDIINQHTNQIATFITEPDKGIYYALNKGLKLSKDDVMGFLHADDLYASDEVLSNRTHHSL
jgi:cellulose synthase/poly-beta-1,6-N-acetylglucosamine synthase-like glycosyltransferase